MQKISTAKSIAAALSALSLAMTALIIPWEGKRNYVYYDTGGVLTACYGYTGKELRLGQYYTDDQCVELLASGAREHAIGMAKCISVAVPQVSLIAFISFTYNLGVRAFCTSTMARKLNAGDLAGACAELSLWVYDDGRRIQGLVNRRAAERAYCEKGLTQ